MIHRLVSILFGALAATAAVGSAVRVRAPGSAATLCTVVSVSALAAGALLLVWAGIRRRPAVPFHGALGRLAFYQAGAAIVFGALLATIVARGTFGWFAALAATALLGHLLFRFFRPPGKAARLAGLWLTSLMLPLLVAEGTLRLSDRAIDSPLLVPVNPTSEARINAWRLKPGDVWMGQKINARGYCDDEHPRRKPPGVFRILILADSFGVGYVPHEQSFPELLEAQLNRDALPGKRFEVVNLSVPSTGPAEYHWLLLHEGLALDPDLVICCVFVGNDFLDDQPVTLGPFDAESYYTGRLVRRLLVLLRYHRRAAAKLVDHHGPAYSPADYLAIERKRLPACYLPQSLNLVPPVLETLERIGTLVSDRLMLLVIPDEFQVNDELFDQLVNVPGAPPRRLFDRTFPNNALAGFCGERGIPCVDPMRQLRAAGEPTYLLRDTHWNAAGNRIAAELLADEVRTWMLRDPAR